MDNPHVQKLCALLSNQWINVLNNFSNDTTPINSIYSNEELSNLNIPSGRTEYSVNGITYNFQTYIVFDIEATSKHYDITGGVVNFNQNRTRPIKNGNSYLIDNLAFISKNLLHTYIRNIDKQAEGITINLKLNPYYSFADYKKLNNLVESIAYHEASHLYDIMVGIRKGESDNKDYHLSPVELRANVASIAIELKKLKELGYNFSDALNSSIGWINYKKKIKELSDYNANNKDQNISYVKKINKMRSKLAHYWNNNLNKMFKDDDLTDISVGDIKKEMRKLCKEFKRREILDFLDAFDVYHIKGINQIEIIGIGEIYESRAYYVSSGPKLELIFKEENNWTDDENYYKYMVENNLFL